MDDNLITPDRIAAEVSKRYGISIGDIRGPKRTRQLSEARRVAVYLIREMLSMPLMMTGEYFCRDHVFVLFCLNQVNQRMQADEEFKRLVDDIRAAVST